MEAIDKIRIKFCLVNAVAWCASATNYAAEGRIVVEMHNFSCNNDTGIARAGTMYRAEDDHY